MRTSFSDPNFPLRFISSRSSSEIRTGFQRFERPVYDYPTKYSPCRAACPAAHDIALALYMASVGRFDLAWELFREESPFPGITGRVCYHPCETACNRGGYDEAVAINALERALDEYGSTTREKVPPARRYPESVGIVGAGPAGLTCAYHLVRLGYGVVIYDANPTPGGMLAYAIPAYRLPTEAVARAVDDLAAVGVEFRCGVRVGSDVSLEELRRTHQAVFLAPGLTASRTPPGLGVQDERVMSGLEFLRRVRREGRVPLHGRVAVIGGGDVAVDAARSALRCGAGQVSIYCPEARDSMPAHPQELSSAAAEGVEVVDRLLPEAVRAGEGLALVMRCVEEVVQVEGGYSFRTGEQTTTCGPFDHVIYAVGQQAELGWVPDAVFDGGRIRCGAFGETQEPGVFAGGDAAGTYNVVNAIASGKRAAIGIDCFLRGWPLECVAERIGVGPEGPLSMRAYMDLREGLPVTPASQPVELEQINVAYFPRAPRAQQPVREGARDFAEANLPLSRTAAEEEAGRCFNCGLCNMCGNCFHFCPDSAVLRRHGWGFEIDLDHCKGCGVCVEECPRGAMKMIPEAEAQEHGK